MKVRKGAVYIFKPVGWDVIDPPYGVKTGSLKPGDLVRVIHMPGCPAPNVLGHCHIETAECGRVFAGLVHCNSLQPYRERGRMVGTPTKGQT